MTFDPNKPSDEDIRVALSDLRHDAGIWEDAQELLAAPRQSAQNLKLPEGALGYVGAPTGLAADVEAARTQLASMLVQAEAYFGTIAGNLRKAANAYEADERNHLHELHKYY
ncbi:hypothetical protein [Amycolatopsis sp. YIM 10]|uniref:hypothetical protein n=1 Tax=Amycolatopsis sp. YIM 10 TaxID=2653857 RepID=UPI0012905EA6|nr:hypothetical protein [Amycolatopsis sp. YIM 10]QFU85278.1 hypothetical protein YIM_00220 [Amycolatopsis sp. YIM 10]